jgi:transposase
VLPPRRGVLIGSRLVRELRARCYDGSSSAPYRLLTRLATASPSAKVTGRFETPPNQQAQFDWSPYTIELGGELIRVIAFGAVLGHSRRKHYLEASAVTVRNRGRGTVERGRI